MGAMGGLKAACHPFPHYLTGNAGQCRLLRSPLSPIGGHSVVLPASRQPGGHPSKCMLTRLAQTLSASRIYRRSYSINCRHSRAKCCRFRLSLQVQNGHDGSDWPPASFLYCSFFCMPADNDYSSFCASACSAALPGLRAMLPRQPLGEQLVPAVTVPLGWERLDAPRSASKPHSLRPCEAAGSQ
jgi:hypothetical protein